MKEYIRIFNNDKTNDNEKVEIKAEKYVNKSSQADAYYFSAQRDSIVFSDINNPDDPTYPFKKKEDDFSRDAVFSRVDNNIKIKGDFENNSYKPDFSIDEFDYEPETAEEYEEDIADDVPVVDDEDIIFDDIYNFDDIDMAVAAIAKDDAAVDAEEYPEDEAIDDGFVEDVVEEEIIPEEVSQEAEEELPEEEEEPLFFDIEGEMPEKQVEETTEDNADYVGPSITIGTATHVNNEDDDIFFEDIDNSEEKDNAFNDLVLPEESIDDIAEPEIEEEIPVDNIEDIAFEEEISDEVITEDFSAQAEEVYPETIIVCDAEDDDIVFEDIDNTVSSSDNEIEAEAVIAAAMPAAENIKEVADEPALEETAEETVTEEMPETELSDEIDDISDIEFDDITNSGETAGAEQIVAEETDTVAFEETEVKEDVLPEKTDEAVKEYEIAEEPVIDLASDNIDEEGSFSSVGLEDYEDDVPADNNGGGNNGDGNMKRAKSDGGSNKKKVLFWVIIAVAAAVLVFSLFGLFGYYTEADKQEQTYGELSAYTQINDNINKNEIVDISEGEISFETGFFGDEKYFFDPEVNDYYYQLAFRDVSAISEDYKDVAAWLYIPGTQISYPVMSSTGNEYLYTNYKGDSVSSGALFFIEPLSFSPQNDNVVIHGHNMKSGMMFGSLKAFWLEEEMWTGNNILYIDTKTETQKYQIFSMYIEDMSVNSLPTDFTSGEEKVAYFNACAAKSKYPANVTFDEDDKIITLSTCTNLENASDNERLLIQAKLID